ncbi:DUF2780 domain-containing protein [Sulfuricurvum sp.]|uniref:DUF2780 domain-containing protein n=1 Tax=Sulfuricurvum sp. TaxID=2025608 RepID=UPI002605A59E|nr:DUF2780 domain-containing protein [Sulfuricurvum sp.]MDD2267765.1 DUF2780 domain-containing protein [Sulfuricurvum sp.]MDD2783801.1 DUF2780 domain-containing protein [Sulfuricurvum sp.]
MRSISLATLLLFGSLQTAGAFDFGSLMQTVAPVAQTAAPIADSALISNPLIKNLTTTLGVTPTQAIGGSAALINNAKGNMSASDFTTLTKQVPQAGTLLNAAPAGLLGMGNVGTQFSALGMDSSMVGKFSPIVLQYLQDGATPGMDKILAAAFAK